MYANIPTHCLFFFFFLFSNSCSLPVESCLGYSTYNWGGGTKAKVTVLALMCQHYSRPEIQAGSLSVPPPSLPAVAGYSSHFSFDRTPFPFLSVLYKPSGRDFTVGSTLWDRLNVTPRANAQINTDNWTRKRIARIASTYYLLDKHRSVRHTG